MIVVRRSETYRRLTRKLEHDSFDVERSPASAIAEHGFKTTLLMPRIIARYTRSSTEDEGMKKRPLKLAKNVYFELEIEKLYSL